MKCMVALALTVAVPATVTAAPAPKPVVPAKPAVPAKAPAATKPVVVTKPAAATKPVAAATKPAAVKKPAVVKKPAPVVKAPVKPAVPTTETVRGPLDLALLAADRRATVSHSLAAENAVAQISDGRWVTSAAGKENTAFCQVVLTQPRAVEALEAVFAGEGQSTWTVAAADTVADLEGKRGTYKLLVPQRTVAADRLDQVNVPQARAYRAYRLECRNLDAAKPVQLAEWSLWTQQAMSRLAVDAMAPSVKTGDFLQLRAKARYEAGARENATLRARWEIMPPERGRVDENGRFEGKTPGVARVTAIHGGVRSAPYEINVLAEGQPDWDVTYIERQPRADHTGPTFEPEVGGSVYWFAHIKNYGTGDAAPVAAEWRIDGKPVQRTMLPKVPRHSQTEAILTTKWDGKQHLIELVVDPDNQVPETSEGNNALSVHADARSLGFWVEDATMRYFHLHQSKLGEGSNSWEDWAQRQVKLLNQKLAETGAGAQRPWRLDRIIVVGDNTLPMSGTSARELPDPRERSVHVMRGFTAYDPARSPLYARTAEKVPDNPFYLDQELVQGLVAASATAGAPKQAVER